MSQEKVKEKNSAKTTFTIEQQRVIDHKKGNLLVSASAGSGKTRTMIERLISLVSNGYTSIDKVLALTFTDASASDMKIKLKDALTEKVNKGGFDHLLSEIDKVYSADISTIDSFCNRLVRKYFFLADVSPDFSICDEGVSEILKKEAMDETFREYYNAQDQKFLLLVDRYSSNRRDVGLKKVIDGVYKHVDTESEFDRLFIKTINQYDKLSFRKTIFEIGERVYPKIKEAQKLIENAMEGLSELECNLYDELVNGLNEFVNELKNSPSIYHMKNVKAFDKRLDFRKKHPEEADVYLYMIKKSASIVKDVYSKLFVFLTTEEEDERALELLKEDSEKIFEIVTKFKDNYDKLKREENCLDFSDVERCALKILKDERAISAISSDYEYVFIDEYQDVNAIQEEIINVVSKDKLFMVGDVKQSIYGFRGCRPDYFEQKYQKMQEIEGQTERLNHNFRSAPQVIQTVNDVFCYSMTKDFYGSDYKGEAELKYGGLFDEFKGRASFDLYLKEKVEKQNEEPRIYNIEDEIKKPTVSETSDTLSLLVKIIKEELKQTRYDIKKGKEVPVTFGDIAVLTRARSTDYVTNLIKGLSLLNIPVTSVAEENVSEYPEVKWLTSLFDLIVSFNDDVALLTVMKSPIGNFTDEELLEITSFSKKDRKQKGYSFSCAVKEFAKNGSGEVYEKTASFISYVDKIRYLSDFVSAGEILDKVMDERNVEANILATSISEQKIERIRFFRERCSKNGKDYSVKEMSMLIKGNDKFLTRLSGGSDDSVKFVSMHSSKGLEFPVVIVLGIEKTLSDIDVGEQVLFDRELGFAVKRYSDEKRETTQTPLRWLFALRRKENLFKEELRLFYVALTRASSSLHLACVAKEDLRGECFTGASKYVDFIPKTIPIKIYSAKDENLPTLELNKRQVLISEIENSNSKIASNLAFRYAFLSDTILPLKSTVTELNKSSKEDYYPINKIFNEEIDQEKQKRGIIAHKILEYYDFSKQVSVKDTALSLINEGVLTKEEVELVDLDKIDRALLGVDSTVFEGASAYKEKNFLLSLPARCVIDGGSDEEVLIQGQIDLLLIKGNEGVIVDYKYSKLNAEKLKRNYKKQLDVYALAVEKILGVKVKGKYVLSLLSGETITVD